MEDSMISNHTLGVS